MTSNKFSAKHMAATLQKKRYSGNKQECGVCVQAAYCSEVVKPACKVDSIAGEIQKEVDLVGCPANDEATADHQRCNNCVTAGMAYHSTARWTHLRRTA